MPSRIQLRRTRGWRKPASSVVVSRPSKWGNPFVVRASSEEHGHFCVVDLRLDAVVRDLFETAAAASERAVELYRSKLRAGGLRVTTDDARRELRGKDLCCWCRLGTPCHADVLMRIANEEPSDA